MHICVKRSRTFKNFHTFSCSLEWMHYKLFLENRKGSKTEQKTRKFNSDLQLIFVRITLCESLNLFFKKNVEQKVCCQCLTTRGCANKTPHSSEIYICLLKHLHATISAWSFDIKLNVTNIVSNFMNRFFFKRMLGTWEVNSKHKFNCLFSWRCFIIPTSIFQKKAEFKNRCFLQQAKQYKLKTLQEHLHFQNSF